jgi:hypothetical protein
MVDIVLLIIWLVLVAFMKNFMCLGRTFVVAKESNRGKATSYEYMG